MASKYFPSILSKLIVPAAYPLQDSLSAVDCSCENRCRPVISWVHFVSCWCWLLAFRLSLGLVFRSRLMCIWLPPFELQPAPFELVLVLGESVLFMPHMLLSRLAHYKCQRVVPPLVQCWYLLGGFLGLCLPDCLLL